MLEAPYLLGKSKQTAKSKQTVVHLKKSTFSFQTSLLWAFSVLEAPHEVIFKK